MGHRPGLCTPVPVNLGIDYVPRTAEAAKIYFYRCVGLDLSYLQKSGFFSNTSMTQALNERQKIREMLAGRPAAA